MESQEEPNWDAIWSRIVADAEAHREAWERQARWLEEADKPSAPTSGKPSRGSLARLSSASTRSNSSTSQKPSTKVTSAGTSSSWYPQPTPNGPSVTFVTYDEYDSSTEPFVYDEPEDPRQPGSHLAEASLHEAHANANIKRAKRLATSFPPGKRL
jgi:hypothetical protein